MVETPLHYVLIKASAFTEFTESYINHEGKLKLMSQKSETEGNQDPQAHEILYQEMSELFQDISGKITSSGQLTLEFQADSQALENNLLENINLSLQACFESCQADLGKLGELNAVRKHEEMLAQRSYQFAQQLQMFLAQNKKIFMGGESQANQTHQGE